MKVFKWNVGMKGLAVGAFGLIAAALLGKVSEMEIEDSVTKLPAEPKKDNDEENSKENSENESEEGEAIKPDEIIDKED